MTTEEENTTTETNPNVEFWRQAAKSEGFDIEDIRLPSSMHGLVVTHGLISLDCRRQFYPYRILVNLYAKVGLHQYNMLKGTSFELDALIKFNMTQNFVSSYYMTLLAHDPVACPLGKTFQVRIDEQNLGFLDIVCSIARPKSEVTTNKTLIPHFHGGATADGIFKGELPDWPSDGDLEDKKRFYLVKESEWLATDWISMYLELAVCAADRTITNNCKVVSQLEIVKVAIETATEDVEPPNERIKAKNMIVYITFKGIEELRAPRQVFQIGVDVERKAIVRRVMNEHIGYLTIVGKLCDGQYSKKPWRVGQSREETQSCEKRARLG